MNEMQGYTFRLRGRRAPLVAGVVGALGTAAVGACFLAIGVAAREERALALASAATGAALVVAAAFALRRGFMTCSELRIGEAGVYFSTLRETRFVAWAEVLALAIEGRLVRLRFLRDGRAIEDVCMDAPRGHEKDLARIELLARSRVVSREDGELCGAAGR